MPRENLTKEERLKRNTEITVEYLEGLGGPTLAKRNNISDQAVRYILRTTIAKAIATMRPEAKALYDAAMPSRVIALQTFRAGKEWLIPAVRDLPNLA